MKRFIIMVVASIVSSCSQESTVSFSRKDTLQTLSLKANLLKLSQDDIHIMSCHTPAILGKILKGQVVTLEDIIKMHEVGLSAESLILIIEHTKSTFCLNTRDCIQLQIEGIPYKVINHLTKMQ